MSQAPEIRGRSGKPQVRIRLVNFSEGFDEAMCRSQVLMDLCAEFDFIFSGEPDVVLVNCYGPPWTRREGGAVAVGYFTENRAPDLARFDYFFGCEYKGLVDDPRYCKLVFGPPEATSVADCRDPERAVREKTHFCNFIYAAPNAYRERFCRALSGYRKVAAPGRRLNNCQDLAARGDPDWQQEKRRYLRNFKFTIAFENSRRAGYVTEKLYDAFDADTVPIYWGDPQLGTVVNLESVIVVEGDWERDVLPWLRLRYEHLGGNPGSVLFRLARKGDGWLRKIRDAVPYRKGFDRAIEEVRELDGNPAAYLRKLAQPRFKHPAHQKIRADYFAFWRGIISRALARAG